MSTRRPAPRTRPLLQQRRRPDARRPGQRVGRRFEQLTGIHAEPVTPETTQQADLPGVRS